MRHIAKFFVKSASFSILAVRNLRIDARNAQSKGRLTAPQICPQLTHAMYKFLFLVLSLTALSACERDECPCQQGKQVEIKKPISAPFSPDHATQTDVQPKVDEFGEYITDGKHPKQRVDLTDHGAGFTYGLFGKMANISRQRFDSLFTQTV